MINFRVNDTIYKWNPTSEFVIVSTLKKTKEIIFGMRTIDYTWEDTKIKFSLLPEQIQNYLIEQKNK